MGGALVTLPYSEIARAKGWTPRGWFGLTEPQQIAVLRSPASPQRARSLGLFGTTLTDIYNPQPPPPETRIDAMLQNEARDAAEIARMQQEADAFAAGVHAMETLARARATTPTRTTTTPTRTTAPAPTPTPAPQVQTAPAAPAPAVAPAPAPTSSALPLLIAAAAAWAVLA